MKHIVFCTFGLKMPIYAPKQWGRPPLPCNTPITRPTPLTIPNGIWIHSAVLPQYTFWTDRLTDTHADRQMGWATGW